MIFIFILFVLLALFLISTTIYAGIIMAPFVATPKEHIREALKLANLKPGEKFYDLGSGDGRVLIIASKKYGIQGIGIELSFLLYLISKINILFSGVSKNIRIKWGNFLKEDLSEADVIFCWLTPRAYPKLENKFKKELKTGTRIIVYSTPLNLWKPEKEIEVPVKAEKIFGFTITPEYKAKIFLYKKQ